MSISMYSDVLFRTFPLEAPEGVMTIITSVSIIQYHVVPEEQKARIEILEAEVKQLNQPGHQVEMTCYCTRKRVAMVQDSNIVPSQTPQSRKSGSTGVELNAKYIEERDCCRSSEDALEADGQGLFGLANPPNEYGLVRSGGEGRLCDMFCYCGHVCASRGKGFVSHTGELRTPERYRVKVPEMTWLTLERDEAQKTVHQRAELWQTSGGLNLCSVIKDPLLSWVYLKLEKASQETAASQAKSISLKEVYVTYRSLTIALINLLAVG